MDNQVLLFLTAFAIGVAQNATWDSIKWAVNQIFKVKPIDIDGLWLRAFYEAINIHNKSYDELSRTYLLALEDSIRSDEAKFKLLLYRTQNRYKQDYGLFLASLESKQFQHQFVEQLLREYSMSLPPDFDVKIMDSVLKDVLAIYRLAIIREISSDETLRLTLLQTLKIDDVKKAIEGLRKEIITPTELSAMFTALSERMSNELEKYADLYQKEYNGNQASIQKARLVSEREIRLSTVRHAIRAKGFHIISSTPPEIDIIAETKGMFSTRIAIRVDGLDGEVSLESVFAFESRFQKIGAKYGYFISCSGFNMDMLNEFAKHDSTRLYTYDEFVNNLVEFDSYINNIISEHKEFEIFRLGYYQRPLGLSKRTPTATDAEGYFEEFLNTSNEIRRVAVLGDYGIGKTTFLAHLKYVLADKYSADPVNNKIPVFINLARYQRIENVDSLIVYALQEKGVDITPALCLELMRTGRFIIILDSFDEMTVLTDKFTLQRNLRDIQQLASVGENFVILGCRTHFFKEDIELEGLRGFEVFYLQEWGRQQLDAYLRLRMPNSYVETKKNIVDNPALWELTKTPLFLEMIVSSLSTLVLDKTPLNPFRLFEVFTENWIRSQNTRSRMTEHEKRDFMIQLGTLLFFQERFSIHFSELRNLVKTSFSLQILEDVDFFDNDTRSCSFLVRDSVGNYRFSHRAFMEYFVARFLINEVSRLSAILDSNSDLESFYFHRKKFSNELYAFLAQGNIPIKTLVRLILATRGKNFTSVRYLGGNAATILRFMNYDFRGEDFSECVLVDVDLSGADLRNVNFTRADLYTSNLSNCNLDDANLSEANMGYGSIKGLSGIVALISASPNNVCLGSLAPEIQVFDSENMMHVRAIEGHSDAVWALASVPGSRAVLAGSKDHTVRLWDINTGELLRAFDGHYDNVWAAASSSTGKKFATGGSDRIIKIWIPETVTCQKNLAGHSDEIRGLCFIDENRIVSCSLDRTVRIWNTETGDYLLYEGVNKFHSMAVVPTRSLVLVGDDGGYISAINLNSMELLWNRKLHTSWLRTISVSPDESYCITGGNDRNLILSAISIDEDYRIVDRSDAFITKSVFISDNEVLYSDYNTNVVRINLNTGEITKYDLTSTIYHQRSVFSCKNLNIRGLVGLSNDRKQYLLDHGAID